MEIDKKSKFIIIFGNGLKNLDFGRQNLDGRAKCFAQKKEKIYVISWGKFIKKLIIQCFIIPTFIAL